jgi:putative tricarboxylic transport membrane protein
VHRAEVALSAGVVALGAGMAAVTASLPSEGGYAGIGPNFFPAVVAGGMVLLGLWLGFEALTGGWRRRDEEQRPFGKASFGWISAALFAHMALIGTAGFVLAGTALFGLVARGFGSRRPARDAGIGLLLCLLIYAFFVKLLNVNLPAGWMPLPL